MEADLLTLQNRPPAVWVCVSGGLLDTDRRRLELLREYGVYLTEHDVHNWGTIREAVENLRPATGIYDLVQQRLHQTSELAALKLTLTGESITDWLRRGVQVVLFSKSGPEEFVWIRARLREMGLCDPKGGWVKGLSVSVSPVENVVAGLLTPGHQDVIVDCEPDRDNNVAFAFFRRVFRHHLMMLCPSTFKIRSHRMIKLGRLSPSIQVVPEELVPRLVEAYLLDLWRHGRQQQGDPRYDELITQVLNISDDGLTELKDNFRQVNFRSLDPSHKTERSLL